MQRKRPFIWLLALLTTLALVAAACGDSDDGEGQGSTGTETGEQQASEADKGGTLILGAEQEPDCVDWIASCAGASWGVWTMQAYTMPRAFDFDGETAEQVPSNLLTGEPTLEEGPPMKITYKINPDAVWSDGTPITSSDFKYTWDQIANGEGIYDKTGYKEIQSVDDSDPQTAVVTFKTQYAAWKDLFGGFYGIYPKHLLEGQDRNAIMKDGYTFSGGPWIIEKWNKGVDVTLIPNDKYWGDKPNLDKVVFKFFADSAAEQAAMKAGEVAMIYPQAQPELTQLQGLPNIEFDATTSLNYEALWFQTEKFPLNDQNVRQALAYATDRKAVVDQLFKPVQPDIEPIDAFMTPANKQWYSEPFDKYNVDLEKVDELMTKAGFAKGSDGVWAKGGQKASLELNTTAGNKRRELTQQIVKSNWEKAGFEVKINNTTPATLFGEWGPQGVFQVALFAQVPSSTDPAICSVFCSENIPTTENPSGTNWYRISDSELDRIWHAVETTLDESERKKLVDAGHKRLAEVVPGIPVDPFPDIIIYNTSKLRGPIGHNVVYGPFHNVHKWYCEGGTC